LGSHSRRVGGKTLKQANKLGRTYAVLIEALNRHHGKGLFRAELREKAAQLAPYVLRNFLSQRSKRLAVGHARPHKTQSRFILPVVSFAIITAEGNARGC
jgi:hypothetical protein